MVRLIDGDSDTQISVADANALLNVWDKERHIGIINEIHTQIFNDILISNNYIGMGELLFWQSDPLSDYYKEAKTILNWFVDTYKLITEYANTVTEETKIDPQEFINSLPKL